VKENLAGSLEPTNAGKGKWWNGLGALEISQLEALGKDINKAVDTTVKQVARGKIRVGKLLLEARGLFIEDQAFGKWRKENTMVQSKQHAHYLMQVAERFGDAPKLIEGANYSVLQELVLADQKDIEWIEAKIEAGDEMPTVVEVRKKVKGTSMKAKLGPNHKPTGSIISPNEHINTIVQLGLAMRIRRVLEREIKDITGDFLILGMDPDPQCPCHPETLNGIRDYWNESTDNPDELRAVRDSYDRIYAEFKGWYKR
jgi:hypothetical protein